MPLEHLNRKQQVQNIEITQQLYDNQQNEAWSVVNGFEGTASIKTKQGAKKAKYDTMNIAQLRDQLLQDKESKSDNFVQMSKQVDRLLTLAGTGGLDVKAQTQTMLPFFETFYQAKEAVNSYIFNHSGHIYREKGERRLQIALRIKEILNQMETTIDQKIKDLNDKEARNLLYKSQNLTDAQIKDSEELLKAENMAADINKIIETGDLKVDVPAQEIQKSTDTWVAKDYSQYLKEIVQGKSLNTKDDKNDFLAFMENQNNRLVANRIAIPMIIDRRKDITLGMPWLRDELETFIKSKVTEKDLFSKPEDFVKKADQICDSFKTDNTGRIDSYKEKREKLCQKLNIPEDAENLYKYAAAEVLITSEDNNAFEINLNERVQEAQKTDKLIDERLKKRFSAATRNKIKEKLITHLGAMRAFESSEQVMAQVDIFLEMLPYAAPEEFRVERQLSRLMDSLLIEEAYRDAFLNKITNNSPSLFATKDNDFWKKKNKKTVEDIRANLKEGRKLMEEKKLFLSMEQWQNLDEAMVESCAMKKNDFVKNLKTIIARPLGQQRALSLREYRERRDYSDSQNLPVQQRKVREEKEKLRKIGNTLDKKFLVHLAGDGNNIYLPYRALNAAYKNTKAEMKAQEKQEKERFEERKADLADVLSTNNIPLTELDRYAEKFKWFMSGLFDITDDMSESMRLLAERRNLERFGVRSWDDAKAKLIAMGNELADIDNAQEVKEAKETYDAGVAVLESYGNEKYKEFVPFITNIPEVYSELLKGPESFKTFLLTMDVKLADFMAGLKKAGKKGDNKGYFISDVARKQYAHMNIRNIYEGSLKGNADFFAQQLSQFQDKLFRVAPEGGMSVIDAIDHATKKVDEMLKKDKIKGDEGRLIKERVLERLYALAGEEVGFSMVTDKKTLEAMLPGDYIRFKTIHDVREKDKDVKNKITNQFKGKKVKDSSEEKEAKEKIKTQKETGVTDRLKFLKQNDYVLEEIRQGKTLVRVAQNGEKAITLDKFRIKLVREKIDQCCDEFDLPNVLKDALAEKAAEGGFFPELDGLYKEKGRLFKHATAMRRMYDLLRRDRVGDPAMSEEEALMFIVRTYGDAEQVKELFDDPKELSVEDIRNSAGYSAFRATYKKLKTFEENEANDPSLDQEIQKISTNLRTMLMTSSGVRDENGKTLTKEKTNAYDVAKRMEKIIDDSNRYVDYWNKVMDVIRPGYMEILKNSSDPAMKKEFSLPEHYFDRKMLALRQYFMSDVIKELEADHPFDENLWRTKLQVFENKEYRRFLDSESSQVSSEEFINAEQTSLERQKTDESAIANLIDKNLYLFKGKYNKYNELDLEQKQLFAVALMYLDKSAIGADTEGTMTLIKADKTKTKQTSKIAEEINNYVEGKEYHFDIDYREAVNKLIDYGVTGYGTTEYTLNDEAYDKAMRFVKKISARKQAFGRIGLERLSDSYESVQVAYSKFGKPVLPTVDALRGQSLTALDVKDRLLHFAKADEKWSSNMVARGLVKTGSNLYTLPVSMAQGVIEFNKFRSLNSTMKKYIDRLQNMNEGDMRMLVHILQNRTLLDLSFVKKEGGAKLHVDQEQRNAILEAFSGDADVTAEVLKDTDNSEACFKAITTALSFQIRDDINLNGGELTKKSFEKSSLERMTMVDWSLFDRALEFLDEIKERRTTIKALKNSANLIKYSGNEQAAKAHKELQDSFANKNDFKQINFEENIKNQAKHDNEDNDREDINNALAGYYALTEQQKVLFFKALCNRDILDISKKDYCKSFMGIKDRNYVNQIGRDKLIDQYIDANREDNMGLKLEDGEYYKAMEMLFTTQISDRVKLSKEKDISKIFSYERNFVMRRSTAIDWKLFKRALSFVNRATEELEMTEGNALLYRGAGDLEKNGRLNMNYGFLRRNFHRTGNQWTRRLFMSGGTVAKYQIDRKDKLGKTLGKISNIIEGAGDGAFQKVGFYKESRLQKGLKSFGGALGDFAEGGKQLEKNLNQENVVSYEKVMGRIHSIVDEDNSADEVVTKLGNFFYEEMIEKTDPNNQQLLPQSENLVEKEIKDTKADGKKGDIRDTVATVKKAKKVVNKVTGIAKKISPEGLKNLVEMMDYAIEKTAFKLFNEKVAGIKVEKSTEDKMKYLQDLKNAAEEYVSKIYYDTLDDMIGEGNIEKIEEISEKYFDFKKRALNHVDSALKTIVYVKTASQRVMNIATCASNINALSKVKEESAAYNEADKKKLDKAKDRGRLDDAQKVKAKKAADKNLGLADTATNIAENMQKIGIADNVIKTVTDTARFVGVGMAGVGSELVITAVQAGLEFVTFAARVLTDKNALRDYYVHTDAGKQEVEKIKSGYQASGNTALYDKFNKVSDPKTADSSIVNMISAAKGYEDTSELVENTGMSMAQSIIFSASEYNPMAESKLMAVTVMSVLGLENLIGDTSMGAVEQLFNAFAMKR